VVIDAFRRVANSPPSPAVVRRSRQGPDGRTARHWTLAEYIAERAPDVAERIELARLAAESSLAELRRKAFVTIVVHRYETFGIVVSEAMAHGCPVVAHANRRHREIH